MIRKLKNAGLGFFVRESETQQKLGQHIIIVLGIVEHWLYMIYTGKIPLRHLVYRVLDLPPSMRPLVYDFGQLNMQTESDYIRQIVFDHVYNHQLACDSEVINNVIIQIHKHPELSKEAPGVKNSIAAVLTWSQGYMRKREVINA